MREQLLSHLPWFVSAITKLSGIRRVALLGSITTNKQNPKDIDFLLVVDDDVDLDAFLDGMELPPDMPPEIARMLLEETRKSVQSGESLDSLLNRVFGPGAGFGGRRKKGRRR